MVLPTAVRFGARLNFGGNDNFKFIPQKMNKDTADKNWATKTYTQTPLHHTYLHILEQKSEDSSARHGVASLYHGHWHLETLGKEDINNKEID